MVFGRKGVFSAGRSNDDVALGIRKMIEVYESLVRRTTKLSTPSGGFDSDIWPPKGAEQQAVMCRETLGLLRQLLDDYLSDRVHQPTPAEMIIKAASIAHVAEDYIENAVATAVSQQAIRKAEKGNA